MSISYRPSHADATYDFKYGARSVQVTSLRLMSSKKYIGRSGACVCGFLQSDCLLHFNVTGEMQGGGRSSARETIGRVAAGAVAKKILKLFSGTEV